MVADARNKFNEKYVSGFALLKWCKLFFGYRQMNSG